MHSTASTFAALFVTLLTAHQWGDHCAQTDHQAAHKGRPEADSGTTNAESWRALCGHLVSYHAVMVVMLAAAVVALDLRVSLAGCTAGVGFSAVSHGFWDRRWPVRAWMVRTGSESFAEQPFGRYTVDQGWHVLCLWFSALLVVLV
ncbi:MULTISPECIES: DUF3307 domain-containing protein [unclassified Kitasatospora]|uniref:DUF3307 domain-containing protein n=1 Tax=unclassified Kitasatospora TaxID=2633591 RepID=UPI0034046413